jgi:hypothetical protein
MVGPAYLHMLAQTSGLQKSAVQTAFENLRRRELIETTTEHVTAIPEHHALRHWRTSEP